MLIEKTLSKLVGLSSADFDEDSIIDKVENDGGCERQGWVLSVQNWFWTGQWTKPGLNRTKLDKT